MENYEEKLNEIEKKILHTFGEYEANLKKYKEEYINITKEIKNEIKTLETEKIISEEMRKKLVNTNSQRIILNVGGGIFETTRQTLTKQPNSMLYSMFCGRNEDIVKPDEKGHYFIDRDPTHFKTILNYLRTNQFIFPKSETERAQLELELDFYCITVSEPITSTTVKPPESPTSTIAGSNEFQSIRNFFPQTNMSFTLLYRATKDGFSSYGNIIFKESRQPRLYLFKTGSNIFGAYSTVDDIGRPVSYYADPDAFIFTLKNKSNIPPEKYMVKIVDNARYFQDSHIINFGGGGDISINMNDQQGYTNFPIHYTCSRFSDYTQGKTFLGGSEKFTVDEVEIFLINK